MKISIIVLLFFLCFSALFSLESLEIKIIDSSSGEEVDLKEMTEGLLKQKVIFFGEYHDNAILHKLELDLLKELYKHDPQIAISLEMFERDVQIYLDDYLSGKITEEEFLSNSRPWPNYETDYKPLIEFAKEFKLDVIAANIPRRYASEVSKKGLRALDSLDMSERDYIATQYMILNDEYKDRFIETMKENMSHNPMKPMGMSMDYDQIYYAQCIKDDTMAESIQRYITKDPGKLVIHYNGDFHSRKHLGTAQKLELLEPDLNIKVIAPSIVTKYSDYLPADLEEADFLILILEK